MSMLTTVSPLCNSCVNLVAQVSIDVTVSMLLLMVSFLNSISISDSEILRIELIPYSDVKEIAPVAIRPYIACAGDCW